MDAFRELTFWLAAGAIALAAIAAGVQDTLHKRWHLSVFSRLRNARLQQWLAGRELLLPHLDGWHTARRVMIGLLFAAIITAGWPAEDAATWAIMGGLFMGVWVVIYVIVYEFALPRKDISMPRLLPTSQDLTIEIVGVELDRNDLDWVAGPLAIHWRRKTPVTTGRYRLANGQWINMRIANDHKTIKVAVWYTDGE